MEQTVHDARLVRFGIFEVDLEAGELRKAGVKLRLSGQPFQVLAILLECPGEIVTRDNLQKRLWPDTFVDVDHNLNTAINKIREVLGDSAENPRFVETLPRRGYRFLAPVAIPKPATPPEPVYTSPKKRSWFLRLGVLLGTLIPITTAGILLFLHNRTSTSGAQRSLTRLTFDDGLQIGATWSPDSRFIAYSSNRGGKFDIWVQQLSGGDPVQITKGPGQNWQPEWSPDGKYIAYRSEAGDGGLFITPALGGAEMERKIASFGYYPRWSPDSSQILFQTTQFALKNRLYVVNLEGATPREVLTQFATDRHVSVGSAAWHPDGKRVSALINSDSIPVFWTVPITEGTAVKSEVSSALLQQIKEISADNGKGTRGYEPEWISDLRFAWAPSGNAIYFQRTFRDVRDIWRMTVDPETLHPLAVERVTTGPGLNTELALSPDGRRLAFTDQSQRVRTWLFPFDAANGKVTGPGQPVASSEQWVWLPDLSRDGNRLVFNGVRSGKWRLKELSLPDGREALVVPDDSYLRDYAQWSPDGNYLAYTRRNYVTGESQVMEWSAQDRSERPLTTPGHTQHVVFDWSRQGDALLLSQINAHTGSSEIAVLPVLRGPPSGPAARSLISNPAYHLFQARYSPHNRWIVFEAVPVNSSRTGEISAIFVSPAAGGPWIRITDGTRWDDKPCWSPDGKIIYFVSGHNGFFNVWGIHFDQIAGKPQGDPFAVTSLDTPSEMVPQFISRVALSVSQNRLALTVTQVSGNIWVLDHIER
jgi:Tol biopolymer transport system component/DNA-binding winged helix-turn-helix (wHTH) protein